MSRRPRNKLPIAREFLRPTAYDVTKVRRSLGEEKERQRHYHCKELWLHEFVEITFDEIL